MPTPDRTLRLRAESRGLLYGACGSHRALAEDSEYARHFAAECGILVPENDLKMGPLRPTPERFDFERSDWLAEFATKHGMKLRGHTLVWHNQLPKWFEAVATAGNARQLMESHIREVAGRYRGRMHSWDVVNEAIDPKSGRPDGLRKTPWLERLGPEYLEMAFHAAAEADPKAMLVYNDFGLDYDQPDQQARRVAVLGLLRRLKKGGVPLHAFGTQAHLSANNANFKAETVKRFFGEVAELGLKILITELDVKDNGLPEEFADRDAAVARHYESYLNAALANKVVIAVLTWGLSDRYTWLSRQTTRPSGTGGRCMPLDREFQRKPAWDAMARAFDGRTV
jgi:endo-1,4-beta-xylanase